MARFVVKAEVTISIHTVVEAANAEAAMAEAEGRDLHSLCFQCGGIDTVTEEWCTSGELDGTPVKMAIEEDQS